MIKKTVFIRGRFERIELTEEERNSVMDKLLQDNMNELDRIIKKLVVFNSNEMPPVEIVKMLFNKQSEASLTALLTALGDKIARLKDDEKAEKDRKYEESKIPSKPIGKPVPQSKEPTKSMVEEAFEKEAFGKENNDLIVEKLKRGM